MQRIIVVAMLVSVAILSFGCGEEDANGPPTPGGGEGWKPVPKWHPPDATEQKSFYERSLKEVTAKHQGYGYTFAVAFSDDGKRLVLGGGRGIQILDVPSMKVLHAVKGNEFGYKTGVTGISCLKSADFLDDKRFVGGDNSGGLVIVDMQKKITEKEIEVFYRSDNNVYVKLFPDRKRVLASGDVAVAKDDGLQPQALPRIVYEGSKGPKSHSVCVVNLESGAVEKEFVNAELVGLSRSSGRFAITRAEKKGASINHVLDIYRCDDLSLIKSFPVDRQGSPRGAFSPNGRYLLVKIGAFATDLADHRYYALIDTRENRMVNKFDANMLDAKRVAEPAGITDDGRYACFTGDEGYLADLREMKILKGWYLGTNDGLGAPDGMSMLMFHHVDGMGYLIDVASLMKETK